jgi:drug/metabolite transporter (DMT)-like permease
MTKQMKADLMLMLVTLFWGVSYWLIDVSLTEVEPFTLNALRFLIAFITAVVFAFPKLKTVNRTTLRYSALIGVALLFVYIGATFGVRYTSLSNAGFLCALTVVITPILAFFVFKQKPEKKLAIAVLMSLIGIALLTLKGNKIRLAAGDLLCIMAAFAYAADLIITESAVKKEQINAFQLGVFQLGFTGLYNLVLAFICETPKLPKSPGTWTAVLFLAIFCTGLAFIVQVLAQQYTSASHVGVIFSLEPVFAGIVAFFLAGEILTITAYTGAALLVAGLFIMELDVGKLVTGFVKLTENFVKKFQKN